MTSHDNRLTSRAIKAAPTSCRGAVDNDREVRGMLRVLEQLGYDLDTLLASTGLRRVDVENPDAYLSPAACAAVFAQAQRERRIPNLALQLALQTPIGATPLLDYLVVSAASVGQALERLTRYLRLVNPAIRLVIHAQRDPVRVAVERAPGPFFTELTVSLSIVRFMRETDGQFRAAHASFTHEPDDVAEYARIFQCPVQAGARWDGWALSRTGMDVPLRRRDPALGHWLERQAGDILAHLPASGDVRDEVRSALSSPLAAGDMRIDVVARRLATTPRTLQRRLARVGTSFEVLCNDVRKHAAEHYLADPTLSIAEVTYLLGYSEPTAFHRAFRRWHGTTPHAFRARMSSRANR
jgi:AraC-like DNA-binding protein